MSALGQLVATMANQFFRRFRGQGQPDTFPGLPAIPIDAIGWVRNGVTDPRRQDWSRVDSRLVLRPDLAEAVVGLDGFSHLIAVCWLDRVAEQERALRQVHPSGDRSLPARGVLALRTHHRPNPIAVSVVKLEAVTGVVVRVRGLDVIDGTPLLDLKPYIPHYDSFPDARLPAWATGG